MTNPRRLPGAVLLLVTACTAREPALKTNPEPPASSAAATNTAIAPAASAVASTPSPVVSATPPSDEPLIREYQELARKPADKKELEAFVSAHPRLLEASAHPYGPSIMWLLEFEDEQGALVLYRAGATVPKSALALAARGDLETILDAMLAKGADPNGADDWGYTPMHLAAKYGHVGTIRKLLAAKAVPSPRTTNEGWTPLHIAVMEREEEVISALIAAHADIEAKDHHGRTPLHWGPYAYTMQPKHIYRKLGQPHDTVFTDPGPANGITLLLKAGAKIDSVDDEGDTPLHEAARLTSVRGAEALLARGAKASVKNKAGQTPIDVAKEAEHRKPVLELLLRAR